MDMGRSPCCEKGTWTKEEDDLKTTCSYLTSKLTGRAVGDRSEKPPAFSVVARVAASDGLTTSALTSSEVISPVKKMKL
ncbi:hypothetical protein SLEP1_g41629 [Rubroshorea leprosula]|uniref:Uncharacterized protein n=1 Tax=Rubroshorea leprosula TaxID=152421 RepID=A0AAV5L7S4_9ROSI|nr:hypothetical protein SLEP1_g41629 [Rubroshorea leprosula]